MVVDEETVNILFVTTVKDASPPRQSEFVRVETVEAKFRSSFPNLEWHGLDSKQKAMFSFLYMKNQMELVAEHAQLGPNDILDAIDPTHLYGQRVWALIRKGGDITPGLGEEVRDHLEAFLSSPGMDVWRHYDKAPTLFNNAATGCNVAMVRFQHDNSTVCYLVAVSNLVFYNIRNHSLCSHEEAVTLYCLNIDRYMRNEMSDKEIFGHIFLNSGGSPVHQLVKMISPFNRDGSEFTRFIYFDLILQGLEDDNKEKDALYGRIKNILQVNGALLVDSFKPFKDYASVESGLEFEGDWKQKTQLPRATGNRTALAHANLIVGVRRHEDNRFGGLSFLIQDSLRFRPFAVVGLDLLRSMNVEKLICLKNGLSYGPLDNTHDLTSWTFSGSHSGDLDSSSPCKPSTDSDYAKNPLYYLHEIKDLMAPFESAS